MNFSIFGMLILAAAGLLAVFGCAVLAIVIVDLPGRIKPVADKLDHRTWW